MSETTVPARPMLLEPDAVVSVAPRPTPLPVTPAPAGPFPWFAAGIGTALLAWLIVSLADWIQWALIRQDWLGWLGASLMVLAAVLLAAGGVREWRALGALRRADRLRTAIAAGDLGPARRAALDWLAALGPAGQAARPAVAQARTAAEVAGLLRAGPLPALAAQSQAAGRRAGLRAAAAVAASPAPALDALVVVVIALGTVRRVATIYGLRPGGVAGLALVRRVLRAAAETAAVDLLADAALERVLHGMPVLNHIAAAVPGAGVAAIRLNRIARLTAAACSPV
jgi:putative membrane protein